jgi:hypothetical protein
MNPLEELARESLRSHLESAGLAPWTDGDHLWIGLGVLRCRVFAGEPLPREIALVPFWFELSLDEGDAVVRESIAGVGATPGEAAVHAAHDWVETVLPPIRAMLDPAYRPDGVWTYDVVSVDGETDVTTAWTVFAGPVLYQGEHTDALQEALDAQTPPFARVLDPVTGYLHLREPHWVKLLLWRVGSELPGEVMIDNEPSDEALERLRAFEWPAREGSMGFRQFLVMAPDPSPAAADPRLEAMSRERLRSVDRPWWRFWG